MNSYFLDQKKFTKIHSTYNDKKIVHRFNYFLKYCDENYKIGHMIKNKKVLDVGCGASGYFQNFCIKKKVEEISCLNVGKSWVPKLKKNIVKKKINIKFLKKNVLELNIKNYFDFVNSQGVLHHLSSKKHFEKSIKNISNSLKKDGYALLTGGYGQNYGLVDGTINPALRDLYKKNKAFKNFIDSLNYKSIQKEFLKIFKLSSKIDKSLNFKEIAKFIKLFNQDTINTIQDRMQPIKTIETTLDEKYFIKVCRKNKLKLVKKIKDPYYLRSDIRKFFSPLHYFRSLRVSNMLSGDQYTKFIFRKY